ncbi:hypothetical protein SPONN_374 [uncultured Candidatus Thioglobus sp.]|nr:hypothetical protein SPONN_374 [uncultured Candidatus Thioglobus sp.]
MWQFVIIGDMVAMGSLIILIMWMSMKQSEEVQDFCMNIPLNDEQEVTGEKHG